MPKDDVLPMTDIPDIVLGASGLNVPGSPAQRRSHSMSGVGGGVTHQMAVAATPRVVIRREDLEQQQSQSWLALYRRHQFLCWTMLLLTILCSIYLYFAITLK